MNRQVSRGSAVEYQADGSNLKSAVSTLQTRLGHGQTVSVARDGFLLLSLCLI